MTRPELENIKSLFFNQFARDEKGSASGIWWEIPNARGDKEVADPIAVWKWIEKRVEPRAGDMELEKTPRNPAKNNDITDETIIEIVSYAREHGAMEASRKFGVPHGTVYDWCKKLAVQPARGNQPKKRDWELLKEKLLTQEKG